jgi:hypothetical protein
MDLVARLSARPGPGVTPEPATGPDEQDAKTDEIPETITPTDRVTPELLTTLLRQCVGKTLEQITASGYDKEHIRRRPTVPACWSDYQ